MCLSRQVYKLVGFAFVDDADLICSGDNGDSVLWSTQKLLNKWRSLMEVTGGAVETRKSYFYVIDYKRTNGKWKAFDPDLGDQVLTLRDKQNVLCPLERLPCNDSAEMLGVWMSMSGNKQK